MIKPHVVALLDAEEFGRIAPAGPGITFTIESFNGGEKFTYTGCHVRRIEGTEWWAVLSMYRTEPSS